MVGWLNGLMVEWFLFPHCLLSAVCCQLFVFVAGCELPLALCLILYFVFLILLSVLSVARTSSG